MNAKQIDPKFHIEVRPSLDGFAYVSIVKTSNGEAIPDDEPLILFRARDHNALATLNFYLNLCGDDGCNNYQLAGIEDRIAAFEKFAADHPERMKQPGVTRGL